MNCVPQLSDLNYVPRSTDLNCVPQAQLTAMAEYAGPTRRDVPLLDYFAGARSHTADFKGIS